VRAALIPAKSHAHAKLRLAQAMPADARADLCRAMLRDVIVACLGSGSFDTVTVLSDDSEVLWQARELGARPLAEPKTLSGLNESLTFGQRYLARRVAVDELVILPADIPLLRPEDLQAVVTGLGSQAEAARRVVIVRARDGGTNALAMRPPEVVPMRFGEMSADAHASAATAAGADVVFLENGRLAFDIDTPDDVVELGSLATGDATAEWIAAHAERAAR
jgi:2-phospho-L-lactate guanylyltransferase